MGTNLDVPRTIFAALRALLDQAGIAHGDYETVLDLEPIRIHSRGGPVHDNVVVTSLLSSRTKEGRVELTLNESVTQMSLDKAREVVGMLQQGIEAAITDQMLYAFLTSQTIGLDDQQAAAALQDFRVLRQGTADIVRPH
jgi:hypothetical protein